MSTIASAVNTTLKSMGRDISWAAVRKTMGIVAEISGEWGGVPIPVDHVNLVMEPRFPFKGLNGAKFGQQEKKSDDPVDYILLNQWRNRRSQCMIYVCREANGKSTCCFAGDGPGRRFELLMNTLGVAQGHVWPVATEMRALEKLHDLVSEHAYICYTLSGMFLETSKRSGVQYLFRKLRPTIALAPHHGDMAKSVKILAALCLHPLGYYQDSYAGVMCPTDDVIAHLMMMRADEHCFWKKANHHDIHEAGSGI